MGESRKPGPAGYNDDSSNLEDGTLARNLTSLPGPGGLNHGDGLVSPAANSGGILDIESLSRRLRTAGSGEELQHLAVTLFGPQALSLGVIVGAGLDLFDAARDLLDLLRIFILADLHDLGKKETSWRQLGNPVQLSRIAVAKLARGFLRDELRRAHQEREAILQELGEVFRNPGDFFEGAARRMVDGLRRDWEEFQKCISEVSLSGQFRAGKILGRLLIDILALITGVAGATRAGLRAASRLPRLVKYAKSAKPRLRGRSRHSGGGSSTSEASPRPQIPRSQRRRSAARHLSTAEKLEGSEFGGVKAQRIRPGADDRIAVIGRSMNNAVEPYADGLRKAGYKVETFNDSRISPQAMMQWKKLRKRYAPDPIPEKTIRMTKLFKENRTWVEKLRDQGYTVVDVGNPANQAPSVFFDMEKAFLFSD